MSLILDALKRAEQERKLGQTPEAVQAATMSPVVGPSHSRDRSLVVVLAILLLAAAIVIAALLLRSHPAADTAASAPLPIVPAQSMRPMPETQPAPAPPKPVSSPAPAVIADRSNVNNMDDVVAADDGRAENAQAAQVAQGNLPSSNTDAASRATLPKGDRPSGHPKMTVTSNTPGAVVQDNDTSDNAEPDAPPRPNVASLRDMPEGYREAFPQLTIDVHVYNDDPEHRFIIVGGNTYHEGSSLPQGPHIVAITSDGVVFEWQGQKVLYGLGSN